MMVSLRTDQALIAEWIEPGSRVLDLGCGDGSLLAHLRDTRQVNGYGIEIDLDNIVACVEKGVNVIQSNLDKRLTDFDDNSFDYVIMTQTLQAVRFPHLLIEEMMRIGRQGIVTFPNFGHWAARLQILFGRMPVTRNLPAQWFDTANIHLCTVADFEKLCADMHLSVLERAAVDFAHRSNALMRFMPNLFGESRCTESVQPAGVELSQYL